MRGRGLRVASCELRVASCELRAGAFKNSGAAGKIAGGLVFGKESQRDVYAVHVVRRLVVPVASPHGGAGAAVAQAARAAAGRVPGRGDPAERAGAGAAARVDGVQ